MSYRVLAVRKDDGLTLVTVSNQRGQEWTFPIFGLPNWLRAGAMVQFVADGKLKRLISA